MSVRQDILAKPNDIAALQKAGRSKPDLVDNLFINFLYYAKHHWSYIASSSSGGEHLLNGTATQVPCGGLANALRIMIEEDLGVAKKADVDFIRITGYVWTKPEFLSFDPKVVGNLRMPSGRDYRHGCVFNEHYYLRCYAKFYDPCLSTTYTVDKACVKETFAGKSNIGIGTNDRMLVTQDGRQVLIFKGDETVAGWQRGAWVLTPATKKDIETVLGKDYFNKEMKVMGGNSQFAQFVNKLK